MIPTALLAINGDFGNQGDTMRRSDKEVTERKRIEDIISASKVCKLAMCVDNTPYIVPLCFGFKDNTLYSLGWMIPFR